MSLSEQEQQALREIERSLLADDPKFGSSVGHDGPALGGGGFTLRGIAIGVVGLLLLIAGVALAQVSFWFIALSVIGFLVMFGAGIWMLRTPRSGVSAGGLRLGGRQPQSQEGNRSSRIEDNFRRRFEEGQQ
ncbi:DUF3040 domain-containing protein [Corynebacterium guangdongense]|uniref:DUF3040 domain-containing protein n=1 Tax=Corynebacterium guangdongense TaxID=1783348 RepID=A0ABU2A0U4_9CORY|nr:DUF3040 domain-containing protein [Corynebacterium guangdongense]MDR7329748.1 hypothetical protein [Corynebacterium guangdongense]WJZ18312.1 hypothetical protein CGUA_08755 [Corynebacterium guangdongense]